MIACWGASSRSVSNVAPGRSDWVLRITRRFATMLDIALIRRDPERVRDSVRRRGQDPAFIDRVTDLDAAWRRALGAVEALKAEKNALTAAISGEVPNVLDAAVPSGAGSDDNVVVRSWGEPRAFDFTPKPHWELGEALGIIDFERAAKLSGSRFSILKGAGVRLHRALAHFFLDRAARNGYTELGVPYLVSKAT